MIYVNIIKRVNTALICEGLGTSVTVLTLFYLNFFKRINKFL